VADGEKNDDDTSSDHDTLPPSPDASRVIENEISGEFDVEELRRELAEDDSPSLPPPGSVDLEHIREGVQYRLVPADIRPSTPSAPGAGASSSKASPSGAWETALEVREKKLRHFEYELRDREERLLEREMVIGGRERILEEREEKLRQREIRLRDWEAKLLDMQAEIRESTPPPGTPAEAEPEPEPEQPRTSSFKIEITSGGGGWELVDEADGEES
jgi:hypothetical protein